jgi:hypothetical protein
MITNYTDLKAIIKTKLEALKTSGGDDLFVAVYNVNNTSPGGYPCAMIMETAGEGEMIDTGRNERVLSFRIKLLQEMGKGTNLMTPVQASAKRLEITDAVMKMFDEDPQLTSGGNSSVVRVNITPISFDEITKDRAIFESEFQIDCVIITQNYA